MSKIPKCFQTRNESLKHVGNLNVKVEKPVYAMGNLICIEILKFKNANTVAKYISNFLKVAILIPFRNRHEHLPIFFRHLIPMLQKQRLEFAFYVVEQVTAFS